MIAFFHFVTWGSAFYMAADLCITLPPKSSRWGVWIGLPVLAVMSAGLALCPVMQRFAPHVSPLSAALGVAVILYLYYVATPCIMRRRLRNAGQAQRTRQPHR